MSRLMVLVAIALVEAILLVSTWDYSVALERENDRLRAQLAPKTAPDKSAYDATLCPNGNSVAQRIDKRRWDGSIYKSQWKRWCV